jgi:type VI secretion system protein ImpF
LLQIIQRDLGYLLNTVNISNLIDAESFPEAGASTINYGIPPLAGGYLSEKKWRNIEQIIHNAIINFEPRLLPESLCVVPMSRGDSTHYYNILQFEIRGLVRADPYPIEFLVQSSVDLDTNHLMLTASR